MNIDKIGEFKNLFRKISFKELETQKYIAIDNLRNIDQIILQKLILFVYLKLAAQTSTEGFILNMQAKPLEREAMRKFMKRAFKVISLPQD